MISTIRYRSGHQLPFGLLLLSSLLLWPSFSGRAQDYGRKWAFVVAIGDYPRTGGWAKISSARDAEVLSATLETLQFDKVVLLQDKQATKRGIIEAFETKVIDQLQPGDVLLFHYSGHGQQISEALSPPNVDDDEIDGFDEALVPWDARDEYRPGIYEGQNHLIDDELHDLLTRAREKMGPQGQLVFSVDACYSGTINRDAGLVKTRGTTKKFSADDVSQTTNLDNRGGGMGEILMEVEGQELAPQIVISASRADEPNYEAVDETGRPIGSLTYAMSRNFARLRPNESFEAFFRQLKHEMKEVAPNQNPQIEGDLQKQVFGSASLPTLGLQLLRLREGGRIAVVQAGTLAGLYPGSEVSLKALDGSGTVLRGEVISSTLTETRVEMKQAVPDDNPGNWQVVVERSVSLAKPMRVAMQIPEAGLANLIRQSLAQQERLQFVQNNGQLLLRQDVPGGPIQLMNSAQERLASWPVQGQDPNRLSGQIVDRIRKHARAEYLRHIGEAEDVVSGLQLQVIPVEVQEGADLVRVSETRPPLSNVLNGHPALPLGTYFIYKVINRTASRLFFTIVGVSSDDEVFTLVPDDVSNPDEFVIEPNGEVLLSRPEYLFQVAEPRGLETYTVLASTRPMDLRPVFRQPDVRTRAGQTEDEMLLQEIIFGSTRSAMVSPGQLAIGSFTIQIE